MLARPETAETVTSWMERINELNESYSLEDIWDMNKSNKVLKVSLQRVSWERKTSKGWQKIETRNNCFFVNAAGEKVDQPIIIWKSHLPWYFKKLQDTWHPANVHYFWNPKSWITSQVMEVVLARFKKACIWGQKSHYFSQQCHVQNLWLISFPRSKIRIRNASCYFQRKKSFNYRIFSKLNKKSLCVVAITMICSNIVSLWTFQYFWRPIFNPVEHLWLMELLLQKTVSHWV